MKSIEQVGVVGAGTMGNGIAHVFALAGHPVTLVDVDPGALERARATIRRNLERQAGKGRIPQEDVEATLGRLRTAEELEDVEGADLVIEAAPEKVDVKRSLFSRLGELVDREAILASNTSSISITDLAARVEPAGRFLGMHFMNPVPVMELVEVVRGLETSEETVRSAVALCRRLGKVPVVVEDHPGFVSNRILMPMINEAVFCLMEGVAGAEEIDRVMTLGMNHPMGPLALADLIGLDTCLSILEVLHRDLGDDKYRPCPLLRTYVAAGRVGRKTGRGFHDYDD